MHEQAVAEVMDKRGGEVLLDISPNSEDTYDTFSAFLESESHALIVGLFEDAIVGYGHLEFSMTNSNKKMASLKEIFVLKDARSVGVGECMMDFITDIAVKNASSGIDSFALPGDRETKNFFESQGMVARLINVYRSLDSGNDSS